MLHHFQMSREESKQLKDIEERLLAIREENERMQQEQVVSESSTTICNFIAQLLFYMFCPDINLYSTPLL